MVIFLFLIINENCMVFSQGNTLRGRPKFDSTQK